MEEFFSATNGNRRLMSRSIKNGSTKIRSSDSSLRAAAELFLPLELKFRRIVTFEQQSTFV